MGLDFSLYWFQKSQGPAKEQFLKWDYNTFNLHELAYARKGWELVYALECDTQNDCFTQLTLDNWVNLMEKMAPIGPYLDEIFDAYHTFENAEEYETLADFEKAYPRKALLIKTYENWFDQSFDEYPQLGYDFSVGYMNSFWAAADEVIKYLEDPDYEVWMCADY